MSDAYVSRTLRERVAVQASHRCGYCLTPEWLIGAPMEIEHIIPRALGGQTAENNLWLACSLCNEYKGIQVVAPDLLTDEFVPLFNPRQQFWIAHFTWSEGQDRIVGLTSTGRATVVALRLNRPLLVRSRQIWVTAGLFPPEV
jgi:5-methylcytosine-specific restriction endonuclease McrA